MKLVLIGFMGAGKSTVGKILAQRLALPFIDTDVLALETSGHSSIAEIFARDGESRFRQIESQIAAKLAQINRGVISTGGGMVLGLDNIRTIAGSAGNIVLLKVSPEVAQKRLALNYSTQRPLARSTAEIASLYSSRAALYQQCAHITINTDNQTPEQVATACLTNLSIRRFVIIGDPIEHSLSPRMHNAAFEALGLSDSHRYVAQQVRAEHFENAISDLKQSNVSGIACTMPHKERICHHLDWLSPEAADAQAVNTVISKDGKWCGYNTDGYGVVSALRHTGTLAGKHTVIIGGGGAARSAALALKAGGASVTFLVRAPDKLRPFAEKHRFQLAALTKLEDLSSADYLINATPLTAPPLDGSQIHPHQVALDMTYHPAVTPFLALASRRGARYVSGLDMLLHQGVKQFEIFTGLSAPTDAMRLALTEFYAAT